MKEAAARGLAGLIVLLGLIAGSGCTSATSGQWAQTAPIIKADVQNPDEPVTLGMRGDRRSFDQSP
jgi:hypothetical protein